MAKPAPLFDSSPAEVGATPSVEPSPPDRAPVTRLRAALVAALLVVGLADLAVVHQPVPVRTFEATPDTTPPSSPVAPSTAATLAPPPPGAAPTTGPSAQNAADVAFVRRYYALLPRDPKAAFRLLGPTARAESGGLPRYAAFHRGIAAISIDPTPLVVAPSTVTAVIRFRRRTGEVTHERYELVVATKGNGARFLRSYRRT